MNFQDRIDAYLLNRMNDIDKEAFLQEVDQDKEKKEQLEFTKNVKDSICSRERKLKALAQFQQQYEKERKAAALGTARKRKILLWFSAVAAVLVVGFFTIRPMFVEEFMSNSDNIPIKQIRSDDEVFSITFTSDSINKDTIEVNMHMP